MGRTGESRWVARLLLSVGGVLLVAGALIGWGAPAVHPALATLPLPLDRFAAPLAGERLDVSAFLGADITALAVIIAVVIGFNATTLQIAGQTHSLSLVRAILWSLSPLLLCWGVTTGVALAYFLTPPKYLGQLWQVLLWFGAVVVLMIAYLWDLPWRLSGEYVAAWALRRLARRPIQRWEGLDGYSALQTAVAGGNARSDLGTVAAITTRLGHFLADVRDPKAEAENAYQRARYRALKNLLSGCAQNVSSAPNAAAYNLGFVLAGTALQGVAVGLQAEDAERDLFSGVFRALRDAPERIDPLFTGMRHALCRGYQGSDPFLLTYWGARPRWPLDDQRRVARVAAYLARFQADCRRALRASQSQGAYDSADRTAAGLLMDLYRDIATHLGPRVASERRSSGPARLADLAQGLLDSVHTAALREWPNGDAGAERVEVVNAYEARRKELSVLLGGA
jgi:hypothetical protein